MVDQPSIEHRLLSTRYTNAQGKIIPLHHAFQVIRFGRGARMTAVCLPIIAMALVWLTLGPVVNLWNQILWFWMPRIAEHSNVGHQMIDMLGQSLNIPYTDFSAAIPSSSAVWINLAATVGLFLLSMLMPGRLLPITYMFRFALLIQCSASIYFLVRPEVFPWDVGSYVAAMLTLGLYMTFLVPLTLGLVFFIFEFPLWWKCLITLLSVCFFIVFLPYQYLAHAWIIHATSLLFLPLMYFLLGILVDVLMFICFFSIGMSWRDVRRKDGDTGRYA